VSANIPANLIVDGGAGSDSIIYDDSASSYAGVYTINNASFSRTGILPFTAIGIEGAGVRANNLNNTINLLSTTAPTTIDGGGGDDTITLGGGSLENIPVLVTVIGGPGTNDVVVLDDSAMSTGELYTISGTTVSRAFFGGIAASSIEGLRLQTQSVTDAITVNSTTAGVPVTIQSGGGSDQITIVSTTPGAPVIVESSLGNDTVNVNTDNTGTAEAVFPSALTTLATLAIGSGGLARLGPGLGTTVRLTTLNLNAAGALDVNQGLVIYDYVAGNPFNSVRSLLASGYAAGAWTGNGIRSAAAAADPTDRTALGFAVSTDLFSTFPATFAGNTIDSTTILIRYTYYGDADLNRSVDLDDFNLLAGSFGAAQNKWSLGNFDYDSDVDLDDFNLLAGNFGLTLSGPEASAAGSSSVVQTPIASKVLRNSRRFL
jgi:hypothetical protein